MCGYNYIVWGPSTTLAKSETVVSPGTEDCTGDARLGHSLLHVTLRTLLNSDLWVNRGVDKA